MKLAFISDIHGNDIALRAVLNDAKKLGVLQLLLCGDLTGYYYNIDKVFELLNQWDWVSCRGNHEDLLKKRMTENLEVCKKIDEKYGSSFKLALQSLDKKKIDFLITLPHPLPLEIENTKFLLCHGSPWDIEKYIYPDNNIKELKQFDEFVDSYDVIILGHTHYQKMWEYGSMLIINPGSVGQPRSGKESVNDYHARAQWGIFDTQTKSYEHRTTFYDASHLMKQILEHDPDLPFLKNVLLRR